jgi:ABC-type lipoprotein export system ATPase subunit
LADEPTSALDAEHAHALMTTLQAQAHEAGAALLVASHDPLVRQHLDSCIALIRRDPHTTCLEIQPHDLA